MRRLQLALILTLAVLIPAQLSLHNHSLIPEGGGQKPPVCVVCAFGTDSTTTAVPALFLHLVVSWLLVASVMATPAQGATRLLPARAPPRA